ncbi:hypothetical protein, partial [Streptomyces lunaelactis]|uniref:hypothetical protein n=1 Tax=Streptomyces lunaelactis TaxID=1535768 RepID=UPI001C30B2B4
MDGAVLGVHTGTARAGGVIGVPLPLHAPLRRVGWCGLVLRRRIGQTAPGAGADDRVPVPGERHAL